MIPVGNQHNLSGNTGTKISHSVKVTMSAKNRAIIRYTLNSKKVNHGSKRYRSGFELFCNGDGFDSDTTTIRAKAYLDGESSLSTVVVVRIEPSLNSVYNTGLTSARNVEKLRGEDIPKMWPTKKWTGKTL